MAPKPEATTETPNEVVTLYEYEVNILKVDSNSYPLSGAHFELREYDTQESTVADVTIPVEESSVEATTEVSQGQTEIVYIPDAKFTFSGLSAGTYRLEETDVPNGYSKIGANNDGYYYIIVGAAGSDGSATITVTDSAGTVIQSTTSFTSGTFTFNVVNKAGSNLPETGGMGTKIFYTLGGILVAGAAVLLIVKRRMNMVQEE
ncbi:MAG: LPXTG cell wall anchor domain-containing protein [Clostridiales bacterium]|nr:LPXTG cell wall anchor domain-containing protein [Clostridiales bacterium]